jgi:hypothetical protein
MVWEVERRSHPTGARSILLGAAHFFPRHFRRDLKRLMREARVVVMEGPLDDDSTRKVLEAGRGSGGQALYDSGRDRIHRALGIYSAPLDVSQMLRDLVFGRQAEWLEQELRGLKPWAAFFGLWTRFRSREGWEHKMDLDVERIAEKLGKPVVHLETIDEQIAALEAVPVARFIAFLQRGDWRAYCEAYERNYLAGDLDALVAASRDFPTYCEPVIGARDPVLAARMEPELLGGDALVVIGVAHCPLVLGELERRGFNVRRAPA